MHEFVDPRSNPEPPPRVSREPASHGEELRELVGLCTAGRVYDVERWIQEGRPIQALTYKRPKKPAVPSPLRATIQKKHTDLVLLLLCNGYRLDLETEQASSVLDEALRLRAFDVLELLLKWGADPKSASTEQVVDTYRSDLIDRFWHAGVDYTDDLVVFASYLARTVNKPLYGWLRKNRDDHRLQDALDVALLEAVIEDEEVPVHLLLWAGANPHRHVPMLRELGHPDTWDEDGLFSSAGAAICFGRLRLLDVLRVAAMPDLEEQMAYAHDDWTLKKLVAIRAPADWSGIILAFIEKMCWRHRTGFSWVEREALKLAEASGGRLVSLQPQALGDLRRQVAGLREKDDLLWLLRWLRKPANCDPSIYVELVGAPRIRARLKELDVWNRYMPPVEKSRRPRNRRRRGIPQQDPA